MQTSLDKLKPCGFNTFLKSSPLNQHMNLIIRKEPKDSDKEPPPDKNVYNLLTLKKKLVSFLSSFHLLTIIKKKLCEEIKITFCLILRLCANIFEHFEETLRKLSTYSDASQGFFWGVYFIGDIGSYSQLKIVYFFPNS